uniref:Uncharacterized protein n=1 Tax=Compsopogon caeruleus TaxID=31354 RepID=A0A7S1XCJ7_9RHOD|mmetsp:Transcript_13594/g.27851  ORF Transcript_13594/g.27851 Transcript_13594/m.27851 type:complete len:128 (+) Transcript_13594:181-564(+)|eukprot:CAMPEP_0184678734 /NCGR_PEP_ID=MMETSP0312-20130426/1534_1 /TAXON_ID=31354 /ORGANISM="Compsopogon coeruleus, Strain SAG 36.94" /LENGTH=127 /DNA_ID=CAMNT_0027127709 /DNA_START=257 /DNA_END=640 /DNA_ORIENTATION=-
MQGLRRCAGPALMWVENSMGGSMVSTSFCPALSSFLPPSRSLSGHVADGDLGRAWKDKESAQEAEYFSKHDQEVLMKLAAKARNMSTPTGEQLAQKKDTLAGILQKHGVTPTDPLLDDILAFKYGKY